ncbi:hypothetical protein HHK36_021094 [Tetracentron sinense]|uniref:Uncharacterized protein n=1 Tax=Tetracentron sinense TaxID=13715 RepID=A0A834YRG5_TETSI|nr:hypothetical protein HHK36_021094 [Tetracentron sinense]
MQPSQQNSRINLARVKSQIVKKLGTDRSKRYFYYLNRLLSQNLSKGEFDKLCYQMLGRENLPLHNLFISSILKNACHSKVPPPIHEWEVRKSTRADGKKSPSREDGYQQNGPCPTPTHAPGPSIWSNGNVLPISPRNGRSGIRDRRLRDRLSPLGPNGKEEFSSHQSVTTNDCVTKVVMENGDLIPCDLQRPVQNHQGLAEQLVNEQEVMLHHFTKNPQIKRSVDGAVSVHSNGQDEVVVVEEGDEEEQSNNFNSTRSPLRAPLGIPFCLASIGGARRAIPVASSSTFAGSFDSGGLFDTETLRKHMEEIAGAQGLEGVSMDCSNLLNIGLDAYLKRLIGSCIELVGARAKYGYEPTKHPSYKQQPHGKLLNGVLPGHHLQMQSSGGPLEGMQEQAIRCPISLLDFKVAMELNPQQLGEDWQLMQEKICMRSFEE